MKINERALVSFASDSTSSDKAGFLHKKGEVNKGFQKRYFVLRGNMLFYYEKKQDKEPVGVIVLENFHVELCATEGSMFAFQIVFEGTGTRRYVLAAEDNDTMESWMKTLTHAGYGFMKTMVDELERRLEALKKAESQMAPNNERGAENVLTSSLSDNGRETSEPPVPAKSFPAKKSQTLPPQRHGRTGRILPDDPLNNRWSFSSSLPSHSPDSTELDSPPNFQDLTNFSERTDFFCNDSLHSSRHFSINDFTPPSFSELKNHEEIEDQTLFNIDCGPDDGKQSERLAFSNSLANKIMGNRRAKSERRHKLGSISPPKNGIGGSFHHQSKTPRVYSSIGGECSSSQFQHLHKLWGAAIWVKVHQYELKDGNDVTTRL